MRILLIAYYYPPIRNGGSQRPLRLAKYLARRGHAVTVLAPAGTKAISPERDMIRIQDPSHNMDRSGSRGLQWLFLRVAVECLNRLGCYSSIYSLWRRRAVRQAGAIWEQSRPEVIVATYPPVETLEIGLHLSRQYRVPLVADFRDGLLFEPVERRLLRHRAVRREYAKLEAQAAREAAAIVTVSPAISRYFQNQYGCSRVATIPNGYDSGTTLRPLAPSPFTAGRFHVVHTGGISLSDPGCDLAPFVRGVEEAMAAAPDRQTCWLFHFAGRISARERRLLRPLANAGMVRLYGQLPRENALWMQQNADLLLLLASPDRTSVATGKLFEYMQARKPVLALAAGTFAADIIAETGIGWTIPANDPRALAVALAAIRERKLAPPAIHDQAVASYDRERQFSKFLALLEQVCP